MGWLGLGLKVGMVAAVAVAVATVWRLSRPRGAWGARLRGRLLLGVPWGTLVVVAGVLAVYFGLQADWASRYGPLHLPFTSWSYRYPLGMVTAPFAHQSFGHLTGNLVGTIVLSPLAEYAVGHFPEERGSSSFGSWRTNPYVRAFLLYPLGVVAVALATSLFHWGPIIGFSGAVFAFAGIALVRYPLATVLALVAREAVSLTLWALQEPVATASAGVEFTRPSWAGIAVLGHFLGLLLGALAGALVFRRRSALPSPGRLAVGAALVATLTDLWALWWYSGPSSYVLYRAAGVGVIVIAGAVVATVVHASDRPLIGDVDRRTAATWLLLVPLVAVAGVALPVNYADVPAGSVPNADGAVTAGGYSVTYAEDVTNQRISGINLSVSEEATDVVASGVIVVNPHREIWTQVAPPSELAAKGYAIVRVGGVGWETRVVAGRTGWNVAGNGSVYRVWVRAGDDPWTESFVSEPRTARPVIADRNVTVVARPNAASPNVTTGYALRVTAGNRTLGTAPMPRGGAPTRAGNLTFVRDGDRVIAVHGGTRVAVASRESRI